MPCLGDEVHCAAPEAHETYGEHAFTQVYTLRVDVTEECARDAQLAAQVDTSAAWALADCLEIVIRRMPGWHNASGAAVSDAFRAHAFCMTPDSLCVGINTWRVWFPVSLPPPLTHA